LGALAKEAALLATGRLVLRLDREDRELGCRATFGTGAETFLASRMKRRPN
jgi:hypothetical protein